MSDSWYHSIGGNLLDSVNRRIDNEINGEPIPAPSQSSNEAPVVATAANETGRTKIAGTGGQVIAGVPNAVLYGGGALLVGLVVFMAVK